MMAGLIRITHHIDPAIYSSGRKLLPQTPVIIASDEEKWQKKTSPKLYTYHTDKLLSSLG